MKVTIENKTELDAALTEAFHTLRTNLLHSAKENKAVMLASCTPEEGKSAVAYHLSKSLASAGKRTLLLDADLRNSKLVDKYGIQSKEGEIKSLAQYLTDGGEWESATCETDVPNLYLTVAGLPQPNPTELLSREAFAAFMKSARDSFDCIVVDTPSLDQMIDAAIVAQKCDASILVVENNAVSYRLAQKVKKQLEQLDCKLLGAVLNRAG